MYKILRMVCGIISALIVAAAIFIFVYLGWAWGLISLCAALVFFGLCLLFKNLQQKEEERLNPPAPKGDFITGKVEHDDKNATDLF